MIMNVEIEYKMLIEEEYYQKLMEVYQKPSILQTNIYYDCKDFPLKERGIGMRIRDKNDTHLFTLKVKLEEGHQEYETDTTQNNIDAFNEDGVRKIFETLHISGPFIETGRLDTWRTEICFKHGILCLDKNEYYGITDYELEFELYPDADTKEGLKEFQSILDQVGLTYTRNTKSKIRRCLSARRTK